MPNWCSNSVTIKHDDIDKINLIEEELQKNSTTQVRKTGLHGEAHQPFAIQGHSGLAQLERTLQPGLVCQTGLSVALANAEPCEGRLSEGALGL